MSKTQSLPQQVAGRALTFVGAQAIDAAEFQSSDLFIERITKALVAYASIQKEPGPERCAIFIEFGMFNVLMPDMLNSVLVEKDSEIINKLGCPVDFNFARAPHEGILFNYSGYTFRGHPIFIIPSDFAGRLDLVVGDLWCFTERWYAPAISAYRGRTEEEQVIFQEEAEKAAEKEAELELAAKKEVAKAEKEHEAAERVGGAAAEEAPKKVGKKSRAKA